MEQLPLGSFIALLAAYPHQEHSVYFDFGTAYPTDFASWRGNYKEAALGYHMGEYNGPFTNRPSVLQVRELLRAAEQFLSSWQSGWKSGDELYPMLETTPVWVANWGNGNTTMLVGLQEDGWCARLRTAHRFDRGV